MFDKDAIEAMARSVKNMSDEERQNRAQSLSTLLEAEMKRRDILSEAATKKKGKVLTWLMSFWKDD
jgi:hypothetical protein